MRWTSFAVLTLTMGLAVPALANMGGTPRTDPTPPPSVPETPPPTQAETARQQAERIYGDAYDEVGKGKKDAAAKKTKNSEKHFKKALEKGQSAVALDPNYYEAWNLIGYSSRQLKNYDGAIEAYGKALAIKPDYAPAIEYLGEAYVETGKIDKAREQLALLVKFDATERGDLQSAIDAYVAAHPEAANATAAPAVTDSAGTTKQ